jgi:xanthine dehydrogenase molybdopterin-binding subunit B
MFKVTGKVFSGENPLPIMIQKLKESSNYDQRRADIEKFNKVHLCFKSFYKSNFLK